MDFILQREDGDFRDVEVFNLWDVLKRHKMQHDFTFMNLEEMKFADLSRFTNAVPVGTLSFVGEWLRRVHGVEQMNPIEVPDCMRVDRFLGRDYAVVDGADVPKNGYRFCKDAGRLKGFSNIGPLELLHASVDDVIVANHPYVVSEVVNINAEYRVIVINDKIEAIQFYDGHPTVFPDVTTIENMVTFYQIDRQRPRAYALDVAVVPTVVIGDLAPESSSMTIVIENHPAACFGTYGYVSNDLPYMYRHGIDYYINVNKPISTFSNFK